MNIFLKLQLHTHHSLDFIRELKMLKITGYIYTSTIKYLFMWQCLHLCPFSFFSPRGSLLLEFTHSSGWGGVSVYLSLIARSRGWALINFFCLWDGRLFEVGANSRLGAYSNKYAMLLSFVKGSANPSHCT